MVFLSFQANRQLDFACSMEISALKLKQSALWSYNIALAGTACGKLLHSLEELFGVPESEASKREGARIASTEYRAPEVETPEEAAATVIEKPTISTPPTNSSTPSASAVRPPPLKRRKVLELITRSSKTFTDKLTHIRQASGYFPTSSITMNVTGVDEKLVEKPDENVSVYRCVLCLYCAEQKGQLFTHVHRVHLGVCIQCRLCDYRTYRGVDMKSHLSKAHPSREDEWLEPLPSLEGLVAAQPEHVSTAPSSIVKDEPASLD